MLKTMYNILIQFPPAQMILIFSVVSIEFYNDLCCSSKIMHATICTMETQIEGYFVIPTDTLRFTLCSKRASAAY